jgi:hypothetical protein
MSLAGNARGGLCTNFKATMSFQQHNVSKSFNLRAKSCSFRSFLLISPAACLANRADCLLSPPLQSPVGVWLNRNSFTFNPLLPDAKAPCVLSDDGTTIGVYACQVPQVAEEASSSPKGSGPY